MSARARACPGCGTEIDGDPRRIWCSERCRKRQYAGVCRDCGASTDGTTPGRGVSERCQGCENKRRRQQVHARIIAEMRRWASLYGEPPKAHEWNRAMARNVCAAATVAEIERRHHEDGPWPPLSTVQRVFGSWSEAIQTAGYTPRPRYRPAAASSREEARL